jgi:hypothetical protein
MNLMGALASRRPAGSRKPELVGETPAFPDIANSDTAFEPPYNSFTNV